MTEADDALPNHRLLTLPETPGGVLSIRAKALLFHDPRSVDLLQHVERIARSEASVLIIGETGTGKELIARHLHQQSGRRGPFLAVNCGAFSEALIDAELFGHETGAFTGAAHARAGWFESANGGTLFLDEIGDLPLSLQVKLLRVLQERQVVRLGSRKSIALDVRLVAATNIDLRQAVDAQHFRADLYWRLSVAPIALPPLRERTGDILPLAQHFIGVYGPRLGLAHVVLLPETEQALLGYAWPGNIRELENVIHFALIVSTQGVIRPQDLKLVPGVMNGVMNGVANGVANHLTSGATNTSSTALPARLQDASAMPLPSPSSSTHNPFELTPEDDDLEDDSEADVVVDSALSAAIETLLDKRTQRLYQEVEQTMLRAAYARAGENQVQAARLLGVTRNTLRTLLKRYRLLADTSATASVEEGMHNPLAH